MHLIANSNNSTQVVLVPGTSTGAFIFIPEWAEENHRRHDEPFHGTREAFKAWCDEHGVDVRWDGNLYVPFSNGKQLYGNKVDEALANLAPLDVPWQVTMASTIGLVTVE